MAHVFEVTDKTSRQIRLTRERWSHIVKTHPYMTNYINEIKETLALPSQITDFGEDLDVRYYYRYYKERPFPSKFLLVIVKYLNGTGYLITAYFEKHIR